MTLSQADIDSLLGSQPADDVGSLLDKPSTGEDIATALQDPTFTPTQEQYKQFEEYNKTKQTDWLQTVLSAADSITQTAGQAAKAAVTTGAALNPKNYLEGLAQGTAQLYGLVAQSQNPDSPLFKLNNLISGTGTIESRYGQFLEARQFNKDLDAYAKGDMTIMFPPEQLNPEFVQGVAMVADPTMFLPGIGQVLGVEKVGAKAVGKAAQIAGRGVQAVARPVEMAASAAERAITGITGVSPEALRGGLATSGVLAATGAAPAVGLIGAVPLAAAGAMDVGRAIEAAGTQLGRAPTRIGALESIGKIPEANLRQRVIGTIGRYGGDAALNAALVGTTGSLEGAAIGGALGYLSGGEEGAAAGIGSGAAAGALGSLGARGVQTLTGQQARAARLNDLTTYIDTLPENKKAAYQTVQERFGTDTASNLMDLETAIRGTRSDIAVDLLTGDEFKKQAGVTARGIVPQENAPTPRILINVDAFSRGKGDTPIYTLGHELVHALASTKQFQGDITALTERLTGAYIPNPDGTMRLTAEGEYTPARVEELFNQYVNKLPDEVKAKAITDNPTAADRAAYVGEELVAEQVGRILSAQKPDAFLRGFGTTRQSFTDMLILQDASRAASRIGQYFEKTFGVTPSDSILFPEIKQSSPILDASLRQLLKARENISDALQKAEFQKSFAINQNNISDPTVADFAVRGGFAVREPDGTVRLLTNGELLEREQRDVRQVKEIVDKLPGARFDIDGNLVGQLSKEQADALNASSVSSQMKERITAVNQAINEGRSVLNEYYPATEKKQDPQSKRWRTRYAGRRMTFRETLFYNLLFSKEGNAYARGIDLTKIRSSLQKHVRNGGVAGLWPDVGAFMGDLAAYLTNRERGENAIPTRQLLGQDKAEFMGSFLNNIEKGGSEFIHSFRLDRFGKMDPGDFRARFGETGYQGMKNRLMPAGTVGDAEAFKSQSGYTVLSKNNKFRLYGPDGALIGIYDSSQKAEKKIYATEARLQPEIDQLQRPARNEVRQTTEAGGRNRSVSRTQGSQAGGEVNQPVRQAGDVGRFMPDQQGFYSKLEEVVANKLPKSATPQQILATVDPAKGSGVKAEELKWTGFAQAVERIAKENGGKVPKEKLMEHLQNEGRVRFEEVTRETKPSDVIDETQYSKYQLPGGQTYREIVLTSDTAAPYTSSHFKDIPNYVAHMRVNERAGPDGKPGLFIEEIQSDRHQQAREKGYAENPSKNELQKLESAKQNNERAFEDLKLALKNDASEEVVLKLEAQRNEARNALNEIEAEIKTKQMGTPDAPFRKDWSLQMFKRGLRDAVASGKEWIGWTTGETQAERYDLSQQVDYIDYRRVGPDKYDVGVVGKNGSDLFSEEGINQSRISDVLGKEIADKMAKGEGQSGGGRMTLRGVDLKVGGEGMKGFYDKILPAEVQKYVKQWGGEVKKSNIPEAPIWRVDITPQMRESVQKTGQPRFMPSDTDYLAAVKAGDTQAAQQMVDQAAKAAGYTVGPVYHGTPTGGFNVFDKRMRGETSGVSRQAFSFTTDQKAAENYSKRLGDEAVRLDAGLRVANDAMRRFDDDEAAQEYFSSKGYTSVEDGMLPEFDWGAIDDVPEFIRELRGHAKDLKPINPDLASSFIEAAKVMSSTKAVPEVKRVFLRIPEDAPVFQATPATLGQVMSGFSAEKQQTKAGIVELPRNERIYYVADSSQVKLADPVTKDAQGNVIPLSQRFQQTSADIRYMPSSLTARDINAIAAEVGGGDVKGGAKAFGAFMRLMRDKGITLRDVVKSYGITLSSIQRQELPVSTIKKNWPDAPFEEGTKVRPEDAFAQLLGTPEGQRYLDAAENGVFDDQAADAVVQKFRSFGFHNKLKEQMKTAVEQFYPKAQEIIDAVNTMPTDRFIDYVRNNFKGISYGKVGFWSGQLGRGDIPTFDSRQGKLVYGKEVPVTKQVLMEQKDRLTQLGIKVPAAFKDFAQTLLHHEVWDRLNQSDTEHGPIKEAMLRYMPQPDPSVPGAYSVTGGFRILPGKTGGRLRVYGPSGALVGITGSLDEAQRMIRRKTKTK